MRATWLITVVLGLLAALAAPALGAPPSAQQYSLAEVEVEQLADGVDWYSGSQPVWHSRGWTARYETYDETGEASSLVTGHLEVEANWNVNLANWRGNLWGSAHYISDVYDDSGWETTWTAQWTAIGSWSGRGVGDGYGEFEGMKISYEVQNIPVPPGQPGMDIVSGFVFTPGQP